MRAARIATGLALAALGALPAGCGGGSTTRPTAATGRADLALTVGVRVRGAPSFHRRVRAHVGQTLQFEIMLANGAAATASRVKLVDRLPPALRLVRGTVLLFPVGPPATGEPFTNRVVGRGAGLGQLPGGTVRRVTFRARVTEAGAGRRVRDTARVSAADAAPARGGAVAVIGG